MSKIMISDRVTLNCVCHKGKTATVTSITPKERFRHPEWVGVKLENGEDFKIDGALVELIKTFKEDNMNEKERFEATMKKIDGAKVCDEYKDFARDVVRGIFGEEKKEEWEIMRGEDIVFGPREQMTLVDKKNGRHFWIILEGRINPADKNEYKYDKDYFYRRVK